MVDLTDPKVTIHHCPLVIDALRTNNHDVLKLLVNLRSANDVLNKVYEYDMLRVTGIEEMEEIGPSTQQKIRETIISHLSENYMLANKMGQPLFDKDSTIHELCHALTKVVLTNHHLIAVHPAIFCSGIVHINLEGNQLSNLPLFHSEGQPQCPLLESLNISGNQFTEISEVLFRLPRLISLQASNNRITALPPQVWLAPKLELLRLASNQIASFPCPDSFTLIRGGSCLDQAPPTLHLQVGSSLLRSVRESHINSTAGTPEELSDLQKGFGLRSLDLSDNLLTEVPKGLGCLSPLLKTLKLSNNRITLLGRIQDYPSHLETLDISNNCIESDFALVQQEVGVSMPRWCYQAQLACLNPVCSHYHHTKLSNLKQLNLSDNRLQTLSLCSSSGGGSELLFHRLNSLRLSRNRLVRVPENTHKLEKLAELNIDGNADIREIPLNLCCLEQLFSFKFEGIQDPIVAELAACQSVSKMRRLMRSRGIE